MEYNDYYTPLPTFGGDSGSKIHTYNTNYGFSPYSSGIYAPVGGRVASSTTVKPSDLKTNERLIDAPTKTFHKQVTVEKIIEVPQVQTQVLVKEVQVPEKYDVPLVQPRQVPVEQKVERNVPVPVDVSTTVKFSMAQIVPKYTIIKQKILVPRYIEYPIATHIEQVDEFHNIIPGPPIRDFEWNDMITSGIGENGIVFQPQMESLMDNAADFEKQNAIEGGW